MGVSWVLKEQQVSERKEEAGGAGGEARKGMGWEGRSCRTS